MQVKECVRDKKTRTDIKTISCNGDRYIRMMSCMESIILFKLVNMQGGRSNSQLVSLTALGQQRLVLYRSSW